MTRISGRPQGDSLKSESELHQRSDQLSKGLGLGSGAHWRYAFDLLELDGEDRRGEPIEVRKRTLTRLLRKDRAGLLISQPIDVSADIAFQHICRLGFEGIVSKKLGSKYESGRSTIWLKTINPKAPALQRLEQEDWRR